MSLYVCPADTVNAPAERVWALLANPQGYGEVWDFTVESVEPPGRARAGQRVDGWSRALGKKWSIRGEVVEADATRFLIRFRMTLSFGVISDNTITCTPVEERRCLVRFG